MSQIENFQLLSPKLTDGGMWLVVMCTSPNYCPNHTCSTDLVIDHDIKAVKSFVIHTIPRYNLLTYTHIPINTRKQYPETFFES